MKATVCANMESICRLCLQENFSLIDIFKGDKNPSIPMQIMACLTLEIKSNDDLPKLICSDCSYQLNKCYYFRKRSQASDSKLRKHFRLIGLGKVSRVFTKHEDEDDFDDELELLSKRIEIIDDMRLQESKEKMNDEVNTIVKQYKEDMQLNYKKDLEKQNKLNRLDLEKQIRLEIRAELYESIQAECVENAKKNLRHEIAMECRKEEMTNLLHDIEEFLSLKRNELREFTEIEKLDDINVEPIHSKKTVNEFLKVENRESLLLETKKRKRQKWDTSEGPVDRCLRSKSKILDKVSIEDMTNESSLDASSTHRDDLQNDGDDMTDTEDNFVVLESPDSNPEDATAKVNENDFFPNNNFHIIESADKHVTSYQIGDNGEIQFQETIRPEDIFVFNVNTDEVDEQTEDVASVKKKSMLNYGDTKKHGEIIKVHSSNNLTNKNVSQDETTTLEFEDNKTIIDINPVGERITDTPKTFKCEQCPRSFSGQSSLDRHLRTHVKMIERGRSYQCPDCDLYLSCSSALRRHMIIHTGKRPFGCSVCGKTFRQREILKRHMNTHSNERQFKCEHCNRSFTQKVNMLQHINSNHMEVPKVQQHACHLCPKRFNHASGLSRHLTSHTGIAFQCTECNRTFNDRSSVKRHINAVHGNEVILEMSAKEYIDDISME